MDALQIRLALRHLRQQHHLSAKELSLRAGLPDYLVSRVENGRLQLDFITAIRLAKAMNILLEDFVHVGQSLDPQELKNTAEIAELKQRIKELGGRP